MQQPVFSMYPANLLVDEVGVSCQKTVENTKEICYTTL